MASSSRSSFLYTGSLGSNLQNASDGIQSVLAVQSEDATVYAFTVAELDALNAALTAVNSRLNQRVILSTVTSGSASNAVTVPPPSPPPAASSGSG